MREARKWFRASFKAKTPEELSAMCPAGSEPNASYRMVTTYWEMVASFVTSGVLNAELFYQSGRELLFVLGARSRHRARAARGERQPGRMEEPRDRGRSIHRVVAGAGTGVLREVQQACSWLTGWARPECPRSARR